jgi:hypothetical protein
MYPKPLMQFPNASLDQRRQANQLLAPVTTDFGSQRQILSSQMPLRTDFGSVGQTVHNQTPLPSDFGNRAQILTSQMPMLSDFVNQRQVLPSQLPMPVSHEFGSQRQFVTSSPQQMPVASDFGSQRQVSASHLPIANDFRSPHQLMPPQLQAVGNVGTYRPGSTGGELNMQQQNVMGRDGRFGGNVLENRLGVGDIDTSYPRTGEYSVSEENTRRLMGGTSRPSVYQEPADLRDFRQRDLEHQGSDRLQQIGFRGVDEFRDHVDLRDSSQDKYQPQRFMEVERSDFRVDDLCDYRGASAGRDRYQRDGGNEMVERHSLRDAGMRQYEGSKNWRSEGNSRVKHGQSTTVEQLMTERRTSGSLTAEHIVDKPIALSREGVFRSLSPEHKRHRSHDNYPQLSSDAANAKFHCQVCKMSFGSFQEFDNHMGSNEHFMNMKVLSAVYQDKNQQLLHSVRRPDNTRHLDNMRKEDDSRSNRPDRCAICGHSLVNVSRELHMKSEEHKHKVYLVNKGCVLCDVHDFTNYQDYVRHIDGKQHKERKQQLRERNVDDRKPQVNKLSKDALGSKVKVSSRSADVVKAKNITVAKAGDKSEANLVNTQSDVGSGSRVSQKSKVNKTELKFTVNVKEEAISQSPVKVCEQPTTEDSLIQVSTKSEQSTVEAVVENSTKPVNKSAEELVYDADAAVGVEEIIKVTGFFCKLCHKFYNNETMARVTHCKSLVHFEKYRESMKHKQLSARMSSVDEVTATQHDSTTPVNKH